MPGEPEIAAAVRRLTARTHAADRRRRGYDSMTPSRYADATEMLREGIAPGVVVAAVNRVNASRWLRKAAADVTDQDVERLLAEQPWEARGDGGQGVRGAAD